MPGGERLIDQHVARAVGDRGVGGDRLGRLGRGAAGVAGSAAITSSRMRATSRSSRRPTLAPGTATRTTRSRSRAATGASRAGATAEDEVDARPSANSAAPPRAASASVRATVTA